LGGQSEATGGAVDKGTLQLVKVNEIRNFSGIAFVNQSIKSTSD